MISSKCYGRIERISKVGTILFFWVSCLVFAAGLVFGLVQQRGNIALAALFAPVIGLVPYLFFHNCFVRGTLWSWSERAAPGTIPMQEYDKEGKG